MKRLFTGIYLLVSVYSTYAQTKTISKAEYRDKTLAMIIGTCGGVVTGYEYLKVYNTPNGYYAPGATMKEPVEFLLGLPDDWFVMLNGTLGGTTKDEFNYFSNFEEGKIYSDDDQHVDFFNQFLLDKYGPSIAFQDIKDGWIYYDLRDFGGTSDALGLIKSTNITAPHCGKGEHGNNGNWLPECYIEHETMGAAFPGMPNKAAFITHKFSSMSGQGEPLEWGKYWAATHSIAYFETDARVVLEKALGVLPQNCYHRTIYQVAKDLYKKYPTDWRAAVREMWNNHARYPFAVGPDKIHLTAGVNNGLAILSVLYGENDYMKTLKIVSLAGGDGDCSAASVCGMMGIIKGMAGTPQAFKDRIYKNGQGIWINDLRHALHMHQNFQINWTFDELTSLYQRNAERSIRAYGGVVTADGYTIATETAFLSSVATPNWDIEQGDLTGWKTWNSGGASIWAERQCNDNTKSCFAASGQYKITTIPNSNAAEAKVYQTITGLKAGATYHIEGKIHTAAGREARFYVENYGGPYKYTSIYKGLSAFPSRELIVKMGPTNTSLDVGLHAVATDNGSKWCSFDDIVINEIEDPAPSIRYEAEAAAVINKGTVSSSTSTSGGKYIGGLTSADSYIEFRNITATYSGEYVIKINYANAGDARAMHKMTVNGYSPGNVEYPDTGPWGSFSANFLDVPVRLNKGMNTIRLAFNTNAAEIDYLDVQSPYGTKGKPSDDAALISGGIYKIVAKHSNKVLDVQGDIANGSAMVQNTYTGAASQYFKITKTGSGVYSIRPLKANQGVEILGATTNNLDKLGLWDYWGGDGQQWAILDATEGYFKVVNLKSGKAMDVSGSSLNDGATVFQYDYLNGNNQQWRFDFVGTNENILPHVIPGLIQAEEFSDSLGIQLQATTDAGGGKNVAFIENGDWMEYKVDVQKASDYQFDFRVASATTGGNITIKAGSTTLGTITIAGTGGWQTWKTQSKTFALSQGLQALRLEFTGGVNINWIDVEPTLPTDIDYASAPNNALNVRPNPSQDKFEIVGHTPFDYTLFDLSGAELESGHGERAAQLGENLKPGIYMLQIKGEHVNRVVKLIKK